MATSLKDLPEDWQREIRKLMSENEFLQVQLQDATDMLLQREEQLKSAEKENLSFAEQQALLESREYEVYSLNKKLEKATRKLDGTLQREGELYDELDATADMKTHIEQLLAENKHLKIQLQDAEQGLEDLFQLNKDYKQRLKKMALLESELEDLQVAYQQLQEKQKP